MAAQIAVDTRETPTPRGGGNTQEEGDPERDDQRRRKTLSCRHDFGQVSQAAHWEGIVTLLVRGPSVDKAAKIEEWREAAIEVFVFQRPGQIRIAAAKFCVAP